MRISVLYNVFARDFKRQKKRMLLTLMAILWGTMSIMLLMARASTVKETTAVLAALGVVMVLTLAALIAAAPLMRFFGDQFESVVTRLLGVLLAALAAQFVIDGLRGSFNL